MAMTDLAKCRNRAWDDIHSLTTDIYNNVNDSQLPDLHHHESLQWCCCLMIHCCLSQNTWGNGASCCWRIGGHLTWLMLWLTIFDKTLSNDKSFGIFSILYFKLEFNKRHIFLFCFSKQGTESSKNQHDQI